MFGIDDLHLEIGVPEETIVDWIKTFNVYIPKLNFRDRIYYYPAAIDVLKFIKECKQQNYDNPEIVEMIVTRGFPITYTDEMKENQADEKLNKEDKQRVMQKIGLTVTDDSEQKKANEIKRLKQEIKELKEENKKLQKLARVLN